jgi:hypothetical protein
MVIEWILALNVHAQPDTKNENLRRGGVRRFGVRRKKLRRGELRRGCIFKSGLLIP